MLKFRDVKIAYKLAIGFGVIILCMLAGGLQTYHCCNELAVITTEIYEHPLEVSRSIRDIKINVQKIHCLMGDLIRAEGSELQNNYDKEIESLEKATLANFAMVKDRFLGDIEEVVDAENVFRSWRELRQKELDLTGMGNRQQAIALAKGPADELIGKLDKRVDYVIEYARIKADEFYAAAKKQRAMIATNLIVTYSLIIFISVVIAWYITRTITRPMSQAVSFLKRLAVGDLDLQIPQGRLDEPGMLNNAMEFLRLKNQEMCKIAHEIAMGNLDVSVEKRSENDCLMSSFGEIVQQLKNISVFANEIASGNLTAKAVKRSEKDTLTDSLNSMIQNLCNSQNQIIQSEKMALLGSLVSGVAHEINTPLAAIQSSSSVISQSFSRFADKSAILADSISQDKDDDRELLKAIMQPRPPVSNSEKRAKRKEIEEKLNSYNIEDSYNIAVLLTDIGLTDNIDKYLEFLKKPQANEILSAAMNYVDINRSIEVINSAIDKTSKIVDAMRNYIYQGDGNEMVPENLVKNIDSVVTLYHNRFKNKADLIIELKYQDIPPVLSWPGKLNQIWTNLINNALDAMDEKGVLTISVSRQGNYALVEISDTGCGVPPEIQDKIFETLFTTKPQGQGTGLGLGICKKIVEEHNGKIMVKSVVGKGTTFSVLLPLVLSEEHADYQQV